ncbi:SPOR domain-containing protein [Micrococcus porci]|uniref:SPOR domain-containing protein n=1 Tax=Micrococcus porci TaxID=2856555 RepID=UPI003CEEF3B7
MTDTHEPGSGYWFNVRTHQIEEGPQSDWRELLGPYQTRQDAENALARVQARNEAADAEDAHDDAWDASPLNDAS